jgi:hypothetical protein
MENTWFYPDVNDQRYEVAGYRELIQTIKVVANNNCPARISIHRIVLPTDMQLSHPVLQP